MATTSPQFSASAVGGLGTPTFTVGRVQIIEGGKLVGYRETITVSTPSFINQGWIIDLVAPFGGAADVIKELRETVFAGKAIHQLMPDDRGQTKTLTWPAVGTVH